jgi:hypothetical protein
MASRKGKPEKKNFVDFIDFSKYICSFAALIKRIKDMEAVVLSTNTPLDLRLITALARELNIDMFSINQEEQEEIEDFKLLSFMQKARKEGLTDKNEVLSKLGIV